MAKARRDGAVRLGVCGLSALRLARGLLEFARGWSQVGASVSLAEACGLRALTGGGLWLSAGGEAMADDPWGLTARPGGAEAVRRRLGKASAQAACALAGEPWGGVGALARLARRRAADGLSREAVGVPGAPEATLGDCVRLAGSLLGDGALSGACGDEAGLDLWSPADPVAAAAAEALARGGMGRRAGEEAARLADLAAAGLL